MCKLDVSSESGLCLTGMSNLDKIGTIILGWQDWLAVMNTEKGDYQQEGHPSQLRNKGL